MEFHPKQTPNTAKFLFILAVAFGVTACANSALLETKPVSTSRNERPSWMPNGQQIVFDSKRDGNYELYIMNKDGTEQTNLTKSVTAELFPSVSDIGDKIAFVGEMDGNYDIYVVDNNGSNRKRLTHDERIDDWPSWRDDDRTIIFDYADDGDYGIVRMDSSGANQHVLVDNTGRTVDPNTVNSSDWIVYSSDELDPGGNDTIFAYNVITKETRPLTDLDIDAGGPAFSYDGEKIVFNAGNNTWDLYSMNADGSNIKKLTSDAGDNNWGAFSPDGSEIAFTSNRNGGWHIFVMNADGSNVRQLTWAHKDKR